jgi:carboxyl-terminal processing protease
MLRPLLILSCYIFASVASAQTSTETTLDSNTLDYYLMQAFLAADSQQRIPLNHIGIQGQQQEAGFLISAVLEGYPAHAAGLNRGDIITSIDGEVFHSVNSFNIERDSRGAFIPVTSEHQLTFQRGTSTSEISLLPVFENLFDSYRSATSNSVLEFSAGNKTIGYLRFWALSRGTSDMINYQELIASLDHCDGIIFDLRNSFGYLDSQHLDLVFNDTNNYFIVSEAENQNFNFATLSPNLDFDNYRKPIALLLNEDTRGGAELFAYQLDKLQRVVSIGSDTPGEIGRFELRTDINSALIEYQAADEVLIDGSLFEGIGIEPELSVPFPYESTTRGDPQYDAAVNALLGII